MRYLFFILSLFAISQLGLANDSLEVKQNLFKNQDYEDKVESLENKLNKYENKLLNETINSYQQTNDRINNYLTFTTIIATIFGLIIAIGGVFIGFESVKSQRRRDEAIKTLEEAKKYVEIKKLDFDQTIANKLGELNNEYEKFLILLKERLLEDINSETQKVKEIAQKKSQEIEDYSIDEKTDEKMESLQNRIQFFESIGIPDDPKILLSKAKLLSEKKMHIESIELLKKLIQIEPENSDAYWQLGWENSKIENNEESIQYYKKCIEFEPDNSSAHNNLAVQLENIEQPLDALKEYEKAIEFNSKKKLYYHNKIRVLKKLNSNDEVLNTYNVLLTIDKGDAETYYSLIEFLKLQGKLEDSLEYHDLAISEVKEDEQEFNYSKAQTLKELQRYDEAIKGFQNSIDNNHRTEHCYLQIADIKFQQGNKEEAIEIIESAINLNPKNASLYAVKANYQIDDDEDVALKTIIEGSEQIEGEFYFQSMGRYFAKRGRTSFANQLYLKSNEIIIKKLPKKKEGDLMNYYEGLIITGDFNEANKFISKYRLDINSDKYKIIQSILELCSQLIQGEINTVIGHTEKYEEYVKNDNFLKIDWAFEDILYNIKEKIDAKNYQVFDAITKLLKGQMILEDFKKLLNE